MSSWLNTTATVQHTTPIPAEISLSKAVGFLHNHVFYIQCDPHMIKYESVAPPSDVESAVPDDRQVTVVGEPAYYSVTDKVHTLPAGLWDSDVVSTYQFMNLEKGVFVRIHSQLSVVMETVWEVRESDDGGAELVEEVLIKASRLLIGTVKSMCDAGWKDIHEKMLGMMKQEGGS